MTPQDDLQAMGERARDKLVKAQARRDELVKKLGGRVVAGWYPQDIEKELIRLDYTIVGLQAIIDELDKPQGAL